MRNARPFSRIARAALGMVLISTAARFATAATADSPDPSPYDTILSASEWIGSPPRLLCACLLGVKGETQGRVLAVYEQRATNLAWRRVFLDLERDAHLSSVQWVELDGDSLPELAVGICKRTRFDPVERNRIFIYDWANEDVPAAKWLGSRVRDPVIDFRFERQPSGRDRLSCLEETVTRGQVWRSYVWTGFGFAPDEP